MKFLVRFLVLCTIVLPTLQAAPDYQYTYRFTNRSGEPTDGITIYSGAAATVAINNKLNACAGWQLSYNAEGFSALSITLQSAPNSVTTSGTTPGAWSTYSGTNVSGTLAMTNTAQGLYIGYAYFPYIRVNLTSATGTGSVDVQLSCWKSIAYVAGLSSAGGGSPAGNDGDVPAKSGTSFISGHCNDASSFVCTIPIVAPSIRSGSSDPACVAGTGGGDCIGQGTAPTGKAGAAELYSKTSATTFQVNVNNGGEDDVCLRVLSNCGGGGTPIKQPWWVFGASINSAAYSFPVGTINRVHCSNVTAPYPGVIVSKLYAYLGAGTGNTAIGIYDSSGSLLTNGGSTTANAPGAVPVGYTFSTPFNLTAGTVYGICYTGDTTTDKFYGTYGSYFTDIVNNGLSTTNLSTYYCSNISTGTTTLTFPPTCGTKTTPGSASGASYPGFYIQ